MCKDTVESSPNFIQSKLDSTISATKDVRMRNTSPYSIQRDCHSERKVPTSRNEPGSAWYRVPHMGTFYRSNSTNDKTGEDLTSLEGRAS